MSEISICTDDENEGEGLLDTTYDSTNASPLLSPSEKGTGIWYSVWRASPGGGASTVYVCRQAVLFCCPLI